MCGSSDRPLESRMICGVSTITSKRSAPPSIPRSSSSRLNTATMYSTCSMIVILGTVTIHPWGIPPAFTSAVITMSSVLMLRRRSSSLSGLMRIPMNGGRIFSDMPRVNCDATTTAWSSSSASGRLPYPSSKSMRKSSTGSRANFSRMRVSIIASAGCSAMPSAVPRVYESGA